MRLGTGQGAVMLCGWEGNLPAKVMTANRRVDDL